MIKKLSIDGYKSLNNFTIEFNKGLNILVGPNGVGKTNICQSLSLLNALTTNSLNELFTQYGGVSSIFNIKNSNLEDKKITISCSGNTDGRFRNENYELLYEYKVSINVTNDALCITEEDLLIKRRSKKGRFKNILSIKQNDNDLTANILDKELIGHYSVINKDDNKLKITLEDDDERNSFLNLFSKLFFVVHTVSRDFFKIKTLNINPSIAREACDITEPKEMIGTGKYLANNINLFSTKKKESLYEINSFLEQIIPNFSNINARISEISMKRYFSLSDKFENEFNSNCLSDGTIKILALLVGIITQKDNTTIIEEPENYMHPYANKLLINYLRETYENGICILTSHSETILNLVKPEELIICEIDKENTTCSRLKDIEQIKEIISLTGFGCGYHYVSGNLGGIPNF